MRYEHYTEAVLPFKKWLRRVARSAWLAALVAGPMLLIGVLGYHTLGNLPWVDSILEASMILGGMGPVSPMTGDAVKLFASAYALLSGLVIIGTTGIILAPWLHRLMHCFHEERRKASRGADRRKMGKPTQN